MKFLILFALFALAVAEPAADADANADPGLVYGAGYYRPAVYGGLYRGAYLNYGGLYGGYPRYVGKRSADAEPTADADADADPGHLYGGLYRPAYYGGLYRGAYYGGHYGGLYGGYPRYVGKRSADAEPAADADADAGHLYGGYYRPAVYGGLYRGAYLNYGGLYGGYPRYVGKRSADAEPAADADADPSHLYRGYYPYGGVVGYNYGYNYGYPRVGYSYGYGIGK